MARILLIDDNADLCVLLRRALQQEEHDVVVAANGREGLALQRARPADVVVTDIFMPEQDGIETIDRMRAEFPRVPVIAISGGGQRVRNHFDYLKSARHVGAAVVLQKPFDHAELVAAVREVLSR